MTISHPTRVRVLFGSESGGGELTAEDIAASLPAHIETEVLSMADVDVASLVDGSFLFVVCSTYGEGELPMGAQPFYDELTASRPDLTGLTYAVFGRGDRTYLKTFAQGSRIIDDLLTELGAQRFGDVCYHDASDWDVTDDLATDWAADVIRDLDATPTPSGLSMRALAAAG